MSFITGILFYIFIALITLTTIAISYLKWNFTYWKRLGLIQRKPTIPFGNFTESAKQIKSPGQIISEIYTEMKQKSAKHMGIYFFHVPVYMPLDPLIIKQVLQNDFEYFTDHGVYFNEKDDPLSAHLFSLEGTKWRNARVKLTPTFTSGKMKIMFPLVVKTSGELKAVLDGYSPNEAVEMKDLLARFTTDVIGSCVFGLECNSLRDPDSEFRKYGRRLFDITGKEVAVSFVGFVSRDLLRLLRVKLLPEIVTKFFAGVVRDTINFREANGVKRNDFIQMLIQMQNDTEDSKMTFDEMAAHAFVFFVAGFETTSTTISLCLAELAQNQQIQDKMRDEINDVLDNHKGELTYEAMMEMHYMDMAINETLRKYPPVPLLPRLCTKDYKLPDTNIILKQGTKMFIPVQGLHYDPEHYENPEVFDPLRFTEENKRSRKQFTFLPFGEGPRICIGLRFGLMQAKIGLIVLLKHYKFKLNAKTEVPVRMDPRNFVSSILGGIWMNIEKISS